MYPIKFEKVFKENIWGERTLQDKLEMSLPKDLYRFWYRNIFCVTCSRIILFFKQLYTLISFINLTQKGHIEFFQSVLFLSYALF